MKMLEHYLYKYFSYTTFKEKQQEIIEEVMTKRNVFAMLATGSGKSLCYQLPALINEGLTIVISPLLALMENQVQELKQKGIKRTAAYNSFLSFKEKKYILSNLSSYKILYISPESIQQHDVLYQLAKQNISLFAVDEAHCISQWGHEFRTDYLKLSNIRDVLGAPPCLALTASAAPEVQNDILQQLQLKDPVIFCDSIDRRNISIEVVPASNEEEKKKVLIDFLNVLPMPGMVYVSSRKKAEKLSIMIKEETALTAFSYHGGMTQEDRNLIQQQFLEGETNVICCTNAFGMGINKPDIRFVLHYNYPKDLESYIQEIGRAGRDGFPSTAILLRSNEDKIFPRRLIENEFPAENQINEASIEIEKNAQQKCSEQFLMERCGFEETHARFFTHYWNEWHNHSHKLNEVKEYILKIIDKRKGWKFTKLKQMEEWIWNDDTCRRKRLLEYFGEKQLTKPEQCCGICGADPLKKERHIKKPSKNMTWKDRLASLFHQCS
ncbi:RecQ family ATP-dependent DNA helicase [Alteribacillus bidgolensis]|uniref:ATP-dependent DNA helicase RecQ n=1 Tax=Alteribacillus bidgolensis TaxID=930129 RepID=A0A1G8C1X0_9BACI|nr:ATP-dependent DNA helicase RecQ [Alteribacillus bidgolensis]SDH39319.1 ATP-dependent DNA helicase RecQ [Alteribacillus bidgolensis]